LRYVVSRETKITKKKMVVFAMEGKKEKVRIKIA
jgi:hypothetical protein